MTTINASTARQTLRAQLDRVERGEEVAITRHGRVVAVLVRPDPLPARRAAAAWAQAESLGESLRRARSEPLPPATIESSRADELVAAVRAARSLR